VANIRQKPGSSKEKITKEAQPRAAGRRRRGARATARLCGGVRAKRAPEHRARRGQRFSAVRLREWRTERRGAPGCKAGRETERREPPRSRRPKGDPRRARPFAAATLRGAPPDGQLTKLNQSKETKFTFINYNHQGGAGRSTA
jgi:hypothetical protein